MAVSISRKRSKSSRKPEAKQSYFCLTIVYNFLSRISALVFLIILIYMWSSFSTLITGNIIHVCFSTRKVNSLYCLSAGTHPSLEIPTSTTNNSSSIITPGIDQGNATNEPAKFPDISYLVTTSSRVDIKDRDDKVANAVKVVEEQLQLHRSWRSKSSKNQATCDAQGIYVYDLPSKFNKDLVGQCRDMVPWQNFCGYLSNEGLGEPIAKLGKGWYKTHQYSLELIFHSRVMKHPCRVYDENVAKLFYVPFYGGLDILRWHFKNVSNDVKDSLSLELVKWLERQGTWKRNSGKDHVFVLGKISWDFRRSSDSPWGTRLLEIDKMQNPIKLLIERQPWHENDIGIPHPTNFHPHSDNDIISWQLKIIRSNRKNLVSFAGAARDDAEDNIRERENMRRYITYELLPGLVYGDYNAELDKFQDAFAITMNNLFERDARGNDVNLADYKGKFGAQEPGTNEEIVEFACTRFKAEFPIFDKVDVNGDNAAPLYKFLKSSKGGLFGDSIKWNFSKFLVDKDGNVVDRYAPTTSPLSIEKDIKKLLDA
ncbi:hypothetical protein JHK86_029950 [Glycine max]|nr:hypothetical protein JHK86_029950 [Glycine max]